MEDIRTEEIASLLKEQLNDLNIDLDVSEVGEVIYVGDGVSRILKSTLNIFWLLFMLDFIIFGLI